MHCSYWFIGNLPFVVCIAYSFPVAGLVITGGIPPKNKALKLSQLQPTAPSLLFLTQVTSPPDYQPFSKSFTHSPPKADGATPSLSSTKEVSWCQGHRDFLHLMTAIIE